MERIAVVGIGSRFMTLFAKRLKNTYADRATVVGVCDTNRVRCEYYRDTHNPEVAIYDDSFLVTRLSKNINNIQKTAAFMKNKRCPFCF